MDGVVVKCVNIVKSYASADETLRILQGVTFEIEAGASAAICGQSGCGKSTLLNILGGLDALDSGSVTVAGQDISGLSESALSAYRKTRVGFIFQFHYLLKDFTALENVMLPAFMAGMPKKRAMERARELLADVNLSGRAGHLPSQLSGGERQRVAVARAMVNDPAVILADEPTGNLDAEHTSLVADILYAEAEKLGKTLVLVTHDPRVAARAKCRFILANGLLFLEKTAGFAERPN